MDEVTAVMGRATLEPRADQAGSYRLNTSISRFLSVSSRGPNVPFAVGRAVFGGSRYVGRVANVGPGATSLVIESADAKPDSTKAAEDHKTFEGTILLAGPGDRLVIPLCLQWQAGP